MLPGRVSSPGPLAPKKRWKATIKELTGMDLASSTSCLQTQDYVERGRCKVIVNLIVSFLNAIHLRNNFSLPVNYR